MIVQQCPRCGADFEIAVRAPGAPCVACGTPGEEKPAPPVETAAPRALLEVNDSHILGETIINEHCRFTWAETIDSGRRTYAIQPHHCAACIAELEKRGANVRFDSAGAR